MDRRKSVFVWRLLCSCGIVVAGCGPIQGERRAKPRRAQLSMDAAAAVSEPSYCNWGYHEVSYSKQDRVDRAKVFRIGEKYVVGYAVGDTDVNVSKEMARELSELASRNEVGPQNRYCTWYNNSGERAQEASFIHRAFSKSDANEAFRQMRGTFTEDSISMASCLEENGYIGIGCNGMRHRGPTAFGMFLAFSGCSPANSYSIVNRLWGEHGVGKMRRRAIQMAYDYGSGRPEDRARLQRALLGKPKPEPKPDPKSEPKQEPQVQAAPTSTSSTGSEIISARHEHEQVLAGDVSWSWIEIRNTGGSAWTPDSHSLRCQAMGTSRLDMSFVGRAHVGPGETHLFKMEVTPLNQGKGCHRLEPVTYRCRMYRGEEAFGRETPYLSFKVEDRC
jgi:hypothetical protein